MSVFKVRYLKAGGHVHCTLFCALSPNMTYAHCGTFCVRAEEMLDLQRAFSGAAFVDGDGGHTAPAPANSAVQP